MLVGFIGIPASGKTTIACSMFSQFKISATNCELLLEEARRYISEFRYFNKLIHNSPVPLTDKDQIEISKRQFNTETYFKHSCGPNTIIISDSSVFNSMLYMSDEFLKKPEVEDFFFNKLNNHYDLIFFCYPVDYEFLPSDSNRVHSKEEFKRIEDRANKLRDRLKSSGNIQIEMLLNDAEARIRDACSLTLNKYCKLIETTAQKEFDVII